MRKNSFIPKGIVATVVVLLICASFVPSISGNIELKKTSISFLRVPPEEEWNKTFGGTSCDYLHFVQQTDDDGYIMVGDTHSYGAGLNDIWLIKTDADGNEQWNKTFGGTNSEVGYSVQQTVDEGYIITGTISYSGTDKDVWLIKTDADGNEQWNKTFGGPSFDGGYSVQQTIDGGYIIGGYRRYIGEPHLWLIKTDSEGSEQWNKTFGPVAYGYSVQQTADDGYIITGETGFYGAGNDDVWLIKTDADGNEQWNKTFGGTGKDEGHSVEQTADGGYVIAGRMRKAGSGNFNTWLIKTDHNGNEEWNTTFGGSSTDEGYSVQQTTDGGYIIGAQTESYGSGQYDFWLIKIEGKNQPPSVEIVNPREGYFHLSGISLFPTVLNLLTDTASFGGFRLRPIQVKVTDENNPDGDRLLVTIYIDNEDKGYGTWNPETGYYEWKWTGLALGTYRLMVRVEDVYGAVTWASIDVWNFCIIP